MYAISACVCRLHEQDVRDRKEMALHDWESRPRVRWDEEEKVC